MLQSILKTKKKKGYKIYSRPFELNIVGIRTNNTVPNSFDDTLNIFYKNSADD